MNVGIVDATDEPALWEVGHFKHLTKVCRNSQKWETVGSRALRSNCRVRLVHLYAFTLQIQVRTHISVNDYVTEFVNADRGPSIDDEG